MFDVCAKPPAVQEEVDNLEAVPGPEAARRCWYRHFGTTPEDEEGEQVPVDHLMSVLEVDASRAPQDDHGLQRRRCVRDAVGVQVWSSEDTPV